ncbi:MAG: hypothetical protein IJP66_08935, partial [Kiritimatiellae bacterium]|nr:hypothetical protein [Kiritimatiellia bacterium]
MRACPLPAALAALAALLAAAQPARAAYVGVTRMDDDAGQGQIAVVSFTSISRARECIYDGLSGIGAQGAAETADAVISWLAMLPSLDCADLSRRATVILVTPPEGQDLPDQVALIPLAPLNGERLLRSSLAEAYTSVSGRGVVYCSGARSDSVPPSLSLIVTRDTAFVASSRESLRWIARHWRDGTIPAIPDVR